MSARKARRVRLFRRGDRGFRDVGRPITCTRGSTVSVYESSDASGPHAWLRVVQGPALQRPDVCQPGDGCAHLNPEQAQALIDRLQTWLDEVRR